MSVIQNNCIVGKHMYIYIYINIPPHGMAFWPIYIYIGHIYQPHNIILYYSLHRSILWLYYNRHYCSREIPDNKQMWKKYCIFLSSLISIYIFFNDFLVYFLVNEIVLLCKLAYLASFVTQKYSYWSWYIRCIPIYIFSMYYFRLFC